MKKTLLICLGWCFVAIAVLGIFLPLLPTTVFLIAASWCFARSSARFHHWLLEHPNLGPLLKAWQNGDGLPLALKLRIIAVLWASLALSMFLIHKPIVHLILIAVGLGVSFYMWRLPSCVSTSASPRTSTNTSTCTSTNTSNRELHSASRH